MPTKPFPWSAIVLAAGVNRRLGESELPKPFLSLAADAPGPTFVDRHLSVLAACGAQTVQVVVSTPVRPIVPIQEGERVRIIANPFDTGTTGSSLSLLTAVRALADEGSAHGLLIMDGDIVYERALMQWIAERCTRSQLFVAPATAGDDEEVRVYGRDAEQPTLIGKGLPSRMTAGLELLGESLGIIFVAPADLEFLLTTLEWLTGWPGERPAYGYAKERSEHEEAWQYFFNTHRMGARQVPDAFLFSECDTPTDYRAVQTEVFPAILARES